MRHKHKKEEQKKKLFLSIVLIIFLVSSLGSVLIYYGNDSGDTFSIDANGKKYKFERLIDETTNSYYYLVKAKDVEFTSYYNPQELYLNIPGEVKNTLFSTPYYYITFDPESENLDLFDFVRFELSNNLPPDKFFIDSVASENEAYNLPIITCNNASVTNPVVFLKNSNITNIEFNNYCINIEYDRQSALQIRDLLIYLSHGINVN